MFRKIVFAVAILLTAFIAVPAQTVDPPARHVIAVTANYNRADVNFKGLENETANYDPARDSIGPEVNWTYYPSKKAPIGVGFTVGVSLHNKDLSGVRSCGTGCTITSTGTSKVAKAYGQYELSLADRKGAFQPSIAAVIGVDQGGFGGVTYVPNAGSYNIGGGHRFYYGAKGVLDFKIGKGVFLRAGAQVTKAFNNDTTQLDVMPQIGLAFKFGR